MVCDPLSNSPFSWVFHNSTPKIFSIVLGEGGGGKGGCREPRNESSSQLHQLLYVSLRNLKRNNKEGNLKGIFHKSIPTKQLYTQCLFSFFILFFFFHFLKFLLWAHKRRYCMPWCRKSHPQLISTVVSNFLCHSVKEWTLITVLLTVLKIWASFSFNYGIFEGLGGIKEVWKGDKIRTS